MCSEKDVLARYNRLYEWVQAERARQGPRPDQRFLRRSRICTEIALLSFQELLGELEEFEEAES